MNYELVEISPDNIKIPKRFRDDYGDILELTKNIEERGQLVPILVDNNNTLIDGHRRVLACKRLNRKVLATRKPSDGFVDNKIDELVINLHRKDFTWREECIAVLMLHETLKSKKGQTPGSIGGWKIKDTAILIGKSVGYTHRQLEIAKLKSDEPEKFEKFETKNEAEQYIDAQKKAAKKMDELRKLGITNIEDIFKLQKELNSIPDPNEKETEKTKIKDKRQGWIYILENPSLIANLVKIGMTQKAPEERAKEISSGTGVPEKFNVIWEEKVSDCRFVEKIIHRQLESFRLKDKKEFFNLPKDKAIDIVKIITKQFEKLSQDVITELYKE
ncbi:GIY-YIG nuclease family protein [Thermodesulfobacteriota bacterium]